MYTPKIFSNENIEEIKSFIEINSFGILISQGESKIIASHIPLHLCKNDSGEDVLFGHLSKGNEQWKNFEESKDVLVIFQGAHSYISSSWYDHENVPTWNYIAVHVYGSIRVIEGELLHHTLKMLVDKYEKKSENPISVEKMSPGFLNKEIKGIVGFEIKIESMEATYKLSQNRDTKNLDNIITQLEKTGDSGSTAIAEEMRKRRKK